MLRNYYFRFLLLFVTSMRTSRGGRGGSPEAVQLPSGNVKVRDCQPISVEVCRPVLGYNATATPNLVGHESQADAAHELGTFNALLQYGCSTRLRFFLCSVYVPLCTEKVQQVIGPCRPLCEDVRQRCEPILNDFGFEWLRSFNCSRFPPQNDEKHMCMPGPAITDVPLTPHRTSTTPRHQSVYVPPRARATSGTDCSRMRNAAAHIYVNRTRQCSLLCHESGDFTSGEKRFAEAWMTAWSVLCFCSTTFTIFSFLIDSSRFRYPERAIVIIAFCYDIISIGYITRLLAGRESVACSVVETARGPQSVLVDSHVDHTDCTVVFILIYFFSMASCTWWFLLTLLWFLVAGMDWSKEAIERHAGVLHVVAWTPPAIQTVAVLIDRSVAADELTGICQVGGTSRSRLLLVIAPLAAFLLAGAAFLVAGFVGLYRIRRTFRRSGSETYRLETLMVRIGVFSLLYIVPAAVALACYCHEHVARNSPDAPHLSSAVLMVKVVFSLMVGILSGMWVWSGKTVSAWKLMFERIFCRRRRPDGSKMATVSGLMLRRSVTPCKTPSSDGHAHPRVYTDRSHSCQCCYHEHSHQHHHHHHKPIGQSLLAPSNVYDDGHVSNLTQIRL